MKIFVLYALGASAEIEALKRVVDEADKRAAAEQALREKHEARVIEAERELQEAVKKNKTVEQSLAGKESELAQALQAADDAREEARGALKDIQEAQRVAAGKAFGTESIFGIVIGGTLSNKLNSFFQGRLRTCRAAYLMLPNSIGLRRRSLQRSTSGRSIWHQIIRCPLSIS